MAPYIQTNPDPAQRVYHVGYHKTATTWLQKHYFPTLADDLTRQGTALFSQEGLSGDFLFDAPETAARLAQLGLPAKAIICLRNQRTAVPSLYWTYVKCRGRLSYRNYMQTLVRNGKFRYATMVEAYFRAFGPENVLVLLYEDFQATPQAFLASILAFLNLDPERAKESPPFCVVNKSMSTLSKVAQFWLNRLTPPAPCDPDNACLRSPIKVVRGESLTLDDLGIHPDKQTAPPRAPNVLRATAQNILTRLEPLFATMEPLLRHGNHAASSQAIADAYAAENIRLQALTGLPLARHAYPGFDNREAP
ncbi:hypothetical protein NNJEOMEG_02694 [Fundidesulfovibrio magnetotacticus]|uniref:Sulfotransferase domain-containing protein n=1 Tax=Fundidesulfovibrio magnetotacticus TaxID=2730080 RepID=A0A6V8LYG8_9BACT|nr:sulfotransferase domain-containing protein [Fundidesulfovibrio magnetotacticus]GFK94846.1 hypothetical protein NNJEOMEG_02694 [Fundidesulfovibrio magnetotacticus]